MRDTFYLTNISPQCSALNRGYWNKLERHVRDLTKDYQNVYVVSGPLYLPNIEENGRRFVKYEVIGPNDVSVPTHFFKVISFEDRQGRKETQAFIMPNEGIPENASLDSFRVSIEKVERAAGMISAGMNQRIPIQRAFHLILEKLKLSVFLKERLQIFDVF